MHSVILITGIVLQLALMFVVMYFILSAVEYGLRWIAARTVLRHDPVNPQTLINNYFARLQETAKAKEQAMWDKRAAAIDERDRNKNA